MKYTVVTTFNADGYNQYGTRMIDTFLTAWPKDVQLLVYAEDTHVSQSAPNLQVLDLAAASAPLVEFKRHTKCMLYSTQQKFAKPNGCYGWMLTWYATVLLD